MQKQFYFLSPVEVVKVTAQNLQEVAEWCGGRVAQTESRRRAGQMDSYVWVPTPKGTAISWAFPGMFITKRLVLTVKDEIRITYAVFRRDYFEKNYFETPAAAVDATWEKGVKHPKKVVHKPEIQDRDLTAGKEPSFSVTEAEELMKESEKPQPTIVVNVTEMVNHADLTQAVTEAVAEALSK